MPKSTGELNPKQIQAFAQIIQWANNRNIKWMVVQSPMMNVQAALAYKSLPKEIQTLIPENRFINGQLAIQPQYKLFIDADHLNPSGVKTFNTWLLDTLNKNAFFD
jgi:hypothetical protein